MKNQYELDREDRLFYIMGTIFGIALLAVTLYLATSGMGA
jgi:hypothetical protein